MNDLQRLPFWHFFVEIEQQLSYERWIDKYRLFLEALHGHGGWIKWGEPGDEWAGFKQFCKFLYLQDHRDEARFDTILDKAIELEKQYLLQLAQRATETKENPNTTQPTTPKDSTTKTNSGSQDHGPLEETTDAATDTSNQGQSTSKAATETLYFHPLLGESPTPAAMAPESAAFLHTDEYFPVTRRQMGVAWQYLRRKERGQPTHEIDLLATIRKIGKEGLLIHPVPRFAAINRTDNLIFFADCRGSMTPFNEFTRRLIHTAQLEGGHSRAAVYYFQNYPTGFVYQKENLSQPVKVATALQKTNKNVTLAIIISDAGAAQSLSAPADYAEQTQIFLRILQEHVAHIIWLNPMPEHRWAGTPAEILKDQVTVMAPVFDEAVINFPNTIRLLLKH